MLLLTTFLLKFGFLITILEGHVAPLLIYLTTLQLQDKRARNHNKSSKEKGVCAGGKGERGR
jgi:hypothetical protein